MSNKSKFLELSKYDCKSILIYASIIFTPTIILLLEQLSNWKELNYDVLFTSFFSTLLIIFKKFVTDYTNE